MSMEKYSKSYDVVVIGCGPGGAAAGKFAAENGARTLILEKKREVGLPVYDSTAVIYGLSTNWKNSPDSNSTETK